MRAKASGQRLTPWVPFFSHITDATTSSTNVAAASNGFCILRPAASKRLEIEGFANPIPELLLNTDEETLGGVVLSLRQTSDECKEERRRHAAVAKTIKNAHHPEERLRRRQGIGAMIVGTEASLLPSHGSS